MHHLLEGLDQCRSSIFFRHKVGPEIFTAAYANEETRGIGGPRSWIEEQLRDEPPDQIGLLATAVTGEMLDFANGPLQSNTIWGEKYDGRDLLISIVTAGIIALECQRQGLWIPPVSETALWPN